MAPNLFRYATKELSQDAFICWLLAWADQKFASEDEAMNTLGLSLVNRILEMHGQPHQEAPTTVKAHRQLMRADVVAEVGGHTVILIEDKVHAGLHGDQLPRYRREMEERFPGKAVLPVFLKTGDQSSYREVEQAGYKLLLRDNILALLRPWKGRTSNSIFIDFLDNLEWLEAQVESYCTRPVSEWTGEWEPWIGFYKRLRRDLSDEIEWDYVPNASGGFLGLWWHSKNWTDRSTGIVHKAYLQIEQGPLCFKIEANKEEVGRAELCARWRTQLAASAREMGTDVPRPARMRAGSSMTVGKIDLNHWMAQDSDGLLNVSGTLETLRQLGSVLDRAVGTHSAPRTVAQPTGE
jgi:hypothetical protein